MKVSICTLTFNHGQYIAQALEGFLEQKTNFAFEIIINDDASTDNTVQIIRDYQQNKKGGERIRLYTNDNNIGMMRNSLNALKRCSGDYVALCEGDDYWNNPNKLQAQSDFLEANTDYSICFHPALELKETGECTLSNPEFGGTNKTFTIEDLALGNFIHTPTVMFRNGLLKEYPSWYLNCSVGDYPLYMLLARHGKIMFSPEAMSIYRVHNSSVWSSLGDVQKREKWIGVLQALIPHFEGSAKEGLKKQEFTNLIHIADHYNYHGNDNKYIRYLSKALQLDQQKTEEWLTHNYLPLVKERLVYPGGVRAGIKHLNKQVYSFILRAFKAKQAP